MAAHGVSRSTYDTDLLSVGPSALEAAVWQTLRDDGIDVDIRHGDDDDPLLGVARCAFVDDAIDVVVGRSAWQRQLNRACCTYGGILAQPTDRAVEDLILLKLY